ncbi:MAG TPA: DUF6452 family protein [Muribaculum sp.]|jgi:hypothetical protein|nr:DUF6452 family protein [Heminiphilus faecis]HRF69020.1 DUF6452 family protein [Muribaculum sp.]
MGKILKLVLLACMLVVLHTSCNTSGCTENKSSIPLAGFYSYETLGAITVNEISIGGVDAPDDSLLLDNGSAGKMYLPFRSTAEETSYFIRYESEQLGGGALYDIITFNYTSIPYFASEECGAMFRYKINEMYYTKHLIDSVGLVDSLITNEDVEKIHIYFRTADIEKPDAPDDPDSPDVPGDNPDNPDDNPGDNPGQNETPDE